MPPSRVGLAAGALLDFPPDTPPSLVELQRSVATVTGPCRGKDRLARAYLDGMMIKVLGSYLVIGKSVDL